MRRAEARVCLASAPGLFGGVAEEAHTGAGAHFCFWSGAGGRAVRWVLVLEPPVAQYSSACNAGKQPGYGGASHGRCTAAQQRWEHMEMQTEKLQLEQPARVPHAMHILRDHTVSNGQPA